MIKNRFFRTYYAKLLVINSIIGNKNEKATEILNLPGVIVKSKKEIEQSLILEVECQSKTAICPHCQRSSHRLHQNHWHLIKDLPWGEKEVFLKINRRQFKCGHCHKIFSEDLSFVGKRKKIRNDRRIFKILEPVNFRTNKRSQYGFIENV